MREHIIYLRLQDITLDPELDRYNRSGEPSKGQSPGYSAGLGGKSDDELRESLREVGMREPLLVKKEAENWVLVDGYRRYYQVRYLAGKHDLGAFLNPEAVPCYVQSTSTAAVETLRLETNERRQALPPSLQAAKFRELLDKHGRTLAQVAKMCGLSVPSVSNYLVINRCIPEVRSAIDKGDLPMSAGKIFNILTEEGQNKLWRKVSGAHGITRRRLWTLAEKFPERFYQRPRLARMERSKHIRLAKRGQVQERGKTRRYLQGDLSSLVTELEFKEQALKDARASLLRLVSWWISALQNPAIKDYLGAKHPERLADIELVLEVEGGYRR